jgi:hypothetical protein
MYRYATILVLLAGCSAEYQMPAPVAYPGACPEGDRACQRNADAQTLSYIGQSEAALKLMCSDPELYQTLQQECGLTLSFY